MDVRESFIRPQDKKIAVLRLLEQEKNPITLRDVVERLGKDFAERSVRRWLFQLVQEGLVEKLGSKRATKYRIMCKGINSGIRDSCFSLESEKTIDRLRRPLYERMPVAYASDWFDTYQPNRSFYIPKEIRSQLHKIGKRSRQEDPAGTYAHQIYNRLLIDLSYNSSRLEGNTYSLLDTQKLVLEGSGAEGKLDEEKIMILNHKEAIRYLVDNASKLEVNIQTVYTLHYLLSDGLVENQYAGKVRDHGVRIGGSSYMPFEDPKELQIRLNLIAEKAAYIEDPYEQSFFLLIHITYLQAFIDVNKRTARLSSNISLIKKNFVPLSFNDIDKDDYITAIIAIYELQDIQPLLDLYIFSYTRTCAAYDATVKAIGFDEIRVRYRAQRRSVLREIILQNMYGKEIDKYIEVQAKKVVKKEDQVSFIEDVFEDIKEIDVCRIVGLGITVEQLNAWLLAQD